MKLTNAEIFTYTNNLLDAFKEYSEYLPAKFNFYFTKNINKIVDAALDIDKVKQSIIKKYKDKDNEKLESELNDLSNFSQDIEILMIPFSWLTEDMRFTPQQMRSIMFMIDKNA